MKNLLALVGLAVVLVAGGGYFLGWYKVGIEPNGSGHTKINVDVNTEKVKETGKEVKHIIDNNLPHNSSTSPQTAVSTLPMPTLPALPAPPVPERSVEGLPTSGLPRVALPPLPAPPVPNGSN